jgi:hypothetical protein
VTHGAALPLWLAVPLTIVSTDWVGQAQPQIRVLVSDVPPIASIILASVAALVSILTLIGNYISGKLAQQDTQFYEALKRFGDPNPTQRASAAHLLSTMAVKRRSYLPTAVHVFGEAVQLEETHVVYIAVVNGLDLCASAAPDEVFNALRSAHASIRDEVCDWMASTIVRLRIGKKSDVSDYKEQAEKYDAYVDAANEDVVAGAALLAGRPYKPPVQREHFSDLQLDFARQRDALEAVARSDEELRIGNHVDDAMGALRRLLLRWSFCDHALQLFAKHPNEGHLPSKARLKIGGIVQIDLRGQLGAPEWIS